jgi:membrane-bound ClpP family serine protease
MPDKADLNRELDRLQQYLPNWAARMVRSLRHPACRVIRITIAILLILGGFVGFLPILGFWMVPLGLALIAQDVPLLRRPMARFLGFVNNKLAPQGSA